MARFQSVTSAAKAPFRGRHNSRSIATMALVVLAETQNAIRCSVDGRPQSGDRDGWLFKNQIEIHQGSEQPFLVVSAPSWKFRERNLYGSQFELVGAGWSAEQRLAFQWAKTWGHKISKARNARGGRQGNLTTFGRAEYF